MRFRQLTSAGQENVTWNNTGMWQWKCTLYDYFKEVGGWVLNILFLVNLVQLNKEIKSLSLAYLKRQ